MRNSEWSSDVCSSDLNLPSHQRGRNHARRPPNPFTHSLEQPSEKYLPVGATERPTFSAVRIRMLPMGFGKFAACAMRQRYRLRGICGALGQWGSKGAFAARCFSRSEENTSELQSLMRISYAVCCL